MDTFSKLRGRGLCCQDCTGKWKQRRFNKRARATLKESDREAA
jgi:hypothetical protein